MNERCPMCGQLLPRPWERQEWRRFDMATGPQSAGLADGVTWVRREPARAATVTDIYVPLAWAGVTALAVGAVAELLAAWRGWALWIGGAVAVGVFCGVWLLLMMQWRDMLYRVEELTGTDVNHDGEVGRPEPVPQVIRLELTDRPDRAMSFVELVGISEADLTKIARLALQDRLNQRGVGLSRERWQTVRDELLARDLLAWKDESEHRLGVVATDLGRQTFESLLNVGGR